MQAFVLCSLRCCVRQTWAEATLNVLTQSLENFGFADLYFNTGPPYVISLDIQGELANTRTMVEAGGFATDLAFQEHVQTIFQKTIDAHTQAEVLQRGADSAVRLGHTCASCRIY